jgi:hypothetical protein
MLLSVAFLFGCQAPAQNNEPENNQIKAERKVFKRSSAQLRSPAKFLMRETGKGIYDPKPRIVVIDEKAGKYEFRWIGYDGKEKVIEYQRYDALDAVVEARVERLDNKFVYYYLIRNLPTSPSYVGSFKVQTFSFDVRDERVQTGEDLYIGHMSTSIRMFSDGIWRSFSPLGEKNYIFPNSAREFKIESVSPPGYVKCYARAGASTLKGVGEHMPYELEAAMPGYEELASCVTIGPDERLARMSKDEKVKYLLDNLPKFVEAGWMAGDTPKIYESILKRGDLSGAFEQARKDLEKEYITSEVFAIIEGLAH